MVSSAAPSRVASSVYSRHTRPNATSDVEYLTSLRLKKQPLSKDQIRAAKEAISRLTNEDLEHAGLQPPAMPVLSEEVSFIIV
jgi:hypothetical protein